MSKRKKGRKVSSAAPKTAKNFMTNNLEWSGLRELGEARDFGSLPRATMTMEETRAAIEAHHRRELENPVFEPGPMYLSPDTLAALRQDREFTALESMSRVDVGGDPIYPPGRIVSVGTPLHRSPTGRLPAEYHFMYPDPSPGLGLSRMRARMREHIEREVEQLYGSRASRDDDQLDVFRYDSRSVIERRERKRSSRIDMTVRLHDFSGHIIRFCQTIVDIEDVRVTFEEPEWTPEKTRKPTSIRIAIMMDITNSAARWDGLIAQLERQVKQLLPLWARPYMQEAEILGSDCTIRFSRMCELYHPHEDKHQSCETNWEIADACVRDRARILREEHE